MAKLNLSGLGIALITPFNEDGSVDFESLGRLLDYQIKSGADYFAILATTGETPTLTAEEKEEIRRFIVKKVDHRVPIILGCGGNCTAAVVAEAQQVDKNEVDAILSVAPYYNKPSQEGLYQHYAAIAKASPVPVVIYNVPGRVGVNIEAETTLRLARDFDNIIAVKEASGKMGQIDQIIENKPKDFVVISGDDGITFPLITLGAVGAISVIGNAFPAEFSKMIRLALNGDYASARQIHRQFSQLFDLLFVDGNPAGVKAVLSMMGYIKNVLRLPLVPTRIETSEKLKRVLDSLNIKIN